jgi:hypothetical protein
MRLSSEQVKRTLSQLNAHVVPDDHPMVPQLCNLFGDHTFFLDSSGLNVIEPMEPAEPGTQTGKVVNLANWTDENLTSLAPHDPELTDLVVVIESRH